MNDARDRLFIGTLVFSLVMTLVFSAALAWDIANNHGGNGATVLKTTTTTDATPSGAAGSSTTGTAGSNTQGTTGGGSGSASKTAIPPGADITVGAVITQSGPLDASDAFRADEAYVQMVNSQGGINGHHLRLDVRDDQGNPSVGRPNFEAIVQEDHALAIVGECAPLTDSTIVDEINQLQVPVVNDCLNSAANAYSSPYIWYTVEGPTSWQGISANYLWKNQNQLKMHKPYVLCVNTSVTIPYCDGFVHQWGANGGTTCSGGKCGGDNYDQEQVATTRIQYESVAQNIKRSGADSIVALLEPTNEAAFLQALSDQGMCPSNGWTQYAPLGTDPSSISAGGNCATGVLADVGNSYFPSEGTPAEQQLKSALQRYSPNTPVDNYSLSIGWTPMVIFGEALRRAGANVSRQSLINQLNSLGGYDTNGLCRPITWTASNHLAPSFTRWATIAGPTSYNVTTGWIDANGNPAG